MREKAQEWLCREIRKTKIAQGQAESRSGVTKEELENLKNKVDVLDWLLEMIGCSSGSRWISAEDRLPGNCDDVLILVCGNVDIGYLSQAGYWECYSYRKNHVTHWMPLPEPPKEETK